jgi:hypothetical protein
MKLFEEYFKRIIKEESWIDKAARNAHDLKLNQDELEGKISKEDRINLDKAERLKQFEKEMSDKLKRIKKIKLLKKYGLITTGVGIATGAGYLAYKKNKNKKQTEDK